MDTIISTGDVATRRMSIGACVRVMGTESTVVNLHESDGVEYELYKSQNRDKHGFFTGAIRVIDVDAMMIVNMISYPSWRYAQAKYTRIISNE